MKKWVFTFLLLLLPFAAQAAQTPNFNCDHLSANQNNPDVTINGALDCLDAAIAAGGSGLINHDELGELDDDDHAAIYVGYESGAGAPSAGAVNRLGFLFFDTTNSKVYAGFAPGGNYFDLGLQSANYTQFTGTSGSANPVSGGGAVLNIAGADATVSSVAADGSPDSILLRSKFLTHATDCTAATGVSGQACFEQDSDRIFICEPSAGDCDTAGEWKLASGASSLTVEEADGAPTVSSVTLIKVSNGTLTDNGGGSVSVTTGSGGGTYFRDFDMSAAIPSDGTGSGNAPAIASVQASTGSQTTDTPKSTTRRWTFDADTDQHIMFEYADHCSSARVVKFRFTNETVQTGTNSAGWKTSLAAITPGERVDNKVFAAVDYATVALANNQAAGTLTSGSITLSNGLDSVANGDLVVLMLGRDANATGSTDSATGLMAVSAVWLECTQ